MTMITVLTAATVTDSVLQEFVEGMGGHWRDDGPYSMGSIERGDAHVSMYVFTDWREGYTDEEAEAIISELGSEPQGVVCIRCLSYPEVRALAEEVRDMIVERWGGYVEDDE